MPIAANLISMFLFAGYAIIPTYLHLSPILIIWFFALGGFLSLLPVAIFKVKLRDLIDLDILVISSIMVLDVFFLLEGYSMLSVGIVTSLHYFGPVIATLVAPIMLKQKFNKKIFLFVVLSFLGTLIMLLKFNGSFNYVIIEGLFFGFMSGITLAGDIIFQNKYMKKNKKKHNNSLINAMTTVFKYNFYILLILTVPVLIMLHTTYVPNYPEILGVGVIIQGVSMVLVNYSSVTLPVNYVGLFGYTEILWSFVYGYFLLHQHVSIFELIGGAMIVAAAYVGYLEKRRESYAVRSDLP